MRARERDRGKMRERQRDREREETREGGRWNRERERVICFIIKTALFFSE